MVCVPGSGWYYTGWAEALGKNPSMDTVQLGKCIIDDYIPADAPIYETYTLAMTVLHEIRDVCDKLTGFFQNEQGLLKLDYKSVSRARNNTRTFGNGMFEQIDLVDFVGNNRTVSKNGSELVKAVNSAVVYSKSTASHANGLAFYFPYQDPDSYEGVSGILRKIGFGEDYFGFYDDFLNTLVQGRVQTVEVSGLLIPFLGTTFGASMVFFMRNELN